MDEAQVTALLEKQATALEEKFTKLLNSSLSGYASRSNKEKEKDLAALREEFSKPKPSEEGKEPETLETKRIAAQLKELQDQLAKKDAEALRLERDNVLNSAITSADAINKTALTKVLKVDLDLVKEEGKWFVKSGDTPMTVEEAVKGYLASDEGKTFLPAPKSTGSGTTETNPTPSSPKSNNSDAWKSEVAAGLMNK